MSLLTRANDWRRASSRNAAVFWGLLALVVWAVAGAVLPRGAPLGVVLIGAVLGTVTALLAMGLILVYRANRVVNFAYGSMGGVAAVLAVNLYVGKHWNYWVCIALGLLTGVAVGAAVEWLVIRRFAKSSRLVLTVATIGLAQVLGGIQFLIPSWLGVGSAIRAGYETPISVQWSVRPYIFDGNHLLIVLAAPAVMAGLTWFLLRTDAGIAVRAAAENADRALLLTIPVRRLATVVWMLAGGLAALTVILKAPFTGLTPDVVSGPVLLLPALAAAVVARMESLPVAVAAGIGLGIVEQLTMWNSDTASTVYVVFLVVILGALLAQRHRLSRAEGAGGSWDLAGIVRPVPAAIRRRPPVRAMRLAALAAVGLALVVAPAFAGPSRTMSLSIGLVYATVALSLVVLTGWGGNISLGQYAFVGVGAMTTGNLVSRWDLDLFVCLALSGLAGAVVALALGLPALRIRGQFLAVTTLAFAVAMDAYFLNPVRFPELVPQTVDRPVLWQRFRLESDTPMYYLCLGVLLATLVAVTGVRRARAGRSQIATRDNERFAEALSVGTTRVKLAGFLFAGVIAGVAGGLHVLLLHGARAQSYPPEQSLVVFSMAVIGGLGSVGGALAGVAAVRIAAEAFPRYQLLLTGAGLLLVLLVLPGGLAQAGASVRDRVLRLVTGRDVEPPAGPPGGTGGDHPADEAPLLEHALDEEHVPASVTTGDAESEMAVMR